jgi:hypothetical protein
LCIAAYLHYIYKKKEKEKEKENKNLKACPHTKKTRTKGNKK